MNESKKNLVKEYLRTYPVLNFMAKKIYLIFKIIKRFSIKIVSIFLLFIPINSKKVVISSYQGKGYGDNGKYIVDELIKRSNEFDIVWLLNPELFEVEKHKENIRYVKYGTLRALYELCTAKFWIDNARKDFYPLKRKNQYYIQTWHGGLGIKKIEGDVVNTLNKEYVRLAKNDSKMADLFISNSKHLTEIYKRAFWYSGEILECGYPKNDLFFKDNRDLKNKVKHYFQIDEDTNILLYAPTFRSENSLDCYNIDYYRILNTLEELTGLKWKILLRFHPKLIGLDSKFDFNNSVLNATSYSDMQELVIASDMLISDYSSCLFDGAMGKIPTFIYATDIKDYITDRGFYFKLEELPFLISENNDQLVENIISFNKEMYHDKIDKFNMRVGLQETGIASKLIVDRIMEIINA